MRIQPLGDRAILVSYGDSTDEATRRDVHAAYELLVARPPTGVSDVVPGFASIAVHYDPAAAALTGDATPHAVMAAAIGELLRSGVPETTAKSRVVEIPVCYDESVAPDLDAVAKHAGMTTREVVEIHTAPDYVVHMIGFLPGFPYLGGLDRRLTIPRRASPRTRVPAGSVAIGGSQTGVYPIQSPGGWQLIGRTTTRLFAIDRAPPVLLGIGDTVRFRAVSIGEYRDAGGE